MANKALATRQKMTIRLEPSQKIAKPRNPVAVAAKQRAAGAHQPSKAAKRQAEHALVKKLLGDPLNE
jgi:hypothetical protein